VSGALSGLTNDAVGSRRAPAELAPPATTDHATAWATWPAALLLIAGVFVVRMIYLVWLTPYELAGDEAYYWECARHLSLCYSEKGPGLAWLIAASCRLFGDTEWAVRLPVALSSAASAWVVGRLAISISGGDARAGFIAVALFACIPAFQANAQIATQDGPTILFWALLTISGLRWVRRWQRGQLRVLDSVAFAFLLGVACLFKQSALLFLLGAGIYLVVQRHRFPRMPRAIVHALAGLMIFTLAISPMILWNHWHGWPTLSHTLGHLGAPGGDQDPAKEERFSIRSPLALVGAQLGAVGIPALLAMGLACARAWRRRHDDPDLWDVRLWLICAAAPAVAFFVFLSFLKPVLGGWPFPSYVPLVALVANVALIEFAGAGGKARGAMSRSLNAAVVYGLCGWLLLSFPNVLPMLPVVGPKFEKSVMRRISGHRRKAAELQAALGANRDQQGRLPIVVTRYYMDAALDAFYLPGHPTVFNAGTMTGQRPTSYDFWPGNDLRSPAIVGRTAILDGHSPTHPWDQVLRFEQLTPTAEGRLFVGRDYRGIAR